MHVKGQSIWEFFIFLQVCYETETALKNKVFQKKIHIPSMKVSSYLAFHSICNSTIEYHLLLLKHSFFKRSQVRVNNLREVKISK